MNVHTDHSTSNRQLNRGFRRHEHASGCLRDVSAVVKQDWCDCRQPNHSGAVRFAVVASENQYSRCAVALKGETRAKKNTPRSAAVYSLERCSARESLM
jgi:hypothetical protein